MFNEESLLNDVEKIWGENGAHADLLRDLIKKSKPRYVYCTSKDDPLQVVYLGTSVDEAEKAVGGFTRFQRPEHEWPHVGYQREHYCALPKGTEWEMIQFFMADGWWYSIVRIEVK